MRSAAADEGQQIREAAFRLLAVRARSTRELRQRLRRKGFSSERVDEVIAYLQDNGYQSDEEFARLYAREKWTSSGWGPARVRQALAEKGIETGLREQVIDEVYGGQDLMETVLVLARKKWAGMRDLPVTTRRRRLTGFLQRRGYSWEIINNIVNRLE
ncbi:MAG: regulatory protein RecX [Fidelibacterota bacterium]|nr:MAG: regulatory protein RecX [Candidatus Neomarinimicrobiota bacterium]